MRSTALILSTLLSCVSSPVFADSAGARVPLLAAFVQECGACHTPYAPGLLPAASWRRLMADLPRHFGTDASLDKAVEAQLAAWLTSNAGSGRRGREEPPQDRITRSAWFTREHREFNAAAWQRPAVKSPSNCGACHTQAAQGRFSEHELRVPR
jgi:mono/diheme cytochrome c family protein